MAAKTAPQRLIRSSARAATDAPAAGRWQLDAANSTLRISVKVGFVATVSGRFADVHGHLDLADDILQSSIAVEVPTSSLTSGSSHWDSVLMSAGLVDTKANPTISFESSSITAADPGKADGWKLSGVLMTDRGCLSVSFDLQCLRHGPDRIRFRATGSVASKDAVRLLSQPGVDRLVGKSMGVDLVIEAVRV